MIVSEYGEDAEALDAENAEDNARADQLGLKYDSDARNGSSPSKQTTEPPEREDGDGTESQQRSA
jgi:capsid protein